MTRKQYVSKMRRFQRNVVRVAKEKTGVKPKVITERVNIPKWGKVIPSGRHKGEKLTSYEQAWDVVLDVLKSTTPEYFEGIE